MGNQNSHSSATQSRNGNGSSNGRKEDSQQAPPPPPSCCAPGGNTLAAQLRKLTGLDHSKSSTDPGFGTPMPDTPPYQRKKREHIRGVLQNNANGSNPLFSSKYKGLEKEASLHNGLIPPGGRGGALSSEQEASNGNGHASSSYSSSAAQIFEGADCERLLHQKYQLLEVVGVGSTSTVHRCVRKNPDPNNHNKNQEFACKIIDCQLIEERFQGMMTQFQTEIHALRQLQHPGIIRLYDVYMALPHKIYIVMELMEGGELFDYVVQKGTLTEEEASQIVRKVTSALVYMHSQNIVHRDLKPENLLLKQRPATGSAVSTTASSNDIDVKVIDFGLSKAMEEPVARTFLGTRGYLAPEMLQRRDYTRAVDSWALGVIVFVLLCGCLPFDDDSATVPSDDLVRAKFVLRFPRWAKNLSPSAKSLLSHLLDVNPRTRYTAEQALDHPWVRGDTAPRANLLASPGRIRKSPLVAKTGGSRNSGNRHYAPPERMTPPTPQGPVMRKKMSI